MTEERKMKAEARLQRSQDLNDWLFLQIEGLETPNNTRCQCAAGCLYVALQHHRAVALLNSQGLHGSAAALARLIFDAYIRGNWLFHCATEADLDRYQKDEHDRSFGNMIKDLEEREAFNVGVLSSVKDVSWKSMNSFTHSGMLQVERHIRSGEIRPDFTEAEIVDGLESADAFGMLAAMAIANLAGDVTLMASILDRSKTVYAMA